MIDKNELIKDIEEYIHEQGDNNGVWYVGLCEEPNSVILNVIKRTSRNWMYIETGSHKIAREVLDFCTNTIGIEMEKDKSRDTKKGKVIYVYKRKTTSTF